jgi:tetratricopeptide (TPR) repeat protein
MNGQQEDVRDTQGGGTGRIWQALLAADETPVDVELLAAFAEGRLSSEQCRAVRAWVARSPMAMEILDDLYDELDALRDEEATEPARLVGPSDEPRDLVVPTAAVKTESTWWPIAVLAIAASLLVAVGTAYLAYEQWYSRGSLQTQLASLSLAQVEDAKRALYARSGLPRTLIGDVSPEAFPDWLPPLETSRGGPIPSDEQTEAEIRRLIQSGTHSLEAAFTGDLERLIEHGAILIAAGKSDEAYQKAQEAANKYGQRPELLNLQAAALMAQAETASRAEFDATVKHAKELLQSITTNSPQYSPAWFNLAVLYSELLRDDEQANQAWQKYLEIEPDATRKQVVRDYLNAT